MICANSPQAKGERKNKFFEDRLIKEMRLKKINTVEEASAFLPIFLEEMNNRFGKEATDPEEGHRALRGGDDLKRIFTRKDKRKLSKDLTFQYHGALYLIQTKSPNRMKHVLVLGDRNFYRKTWSENSRGSPIVKRAVLMKYS